MPSHRLIPLLLLAACGAADKPGEAAPDSAATPAATVAPAVDSIVGSANLRCGDKSEWRATYFVGDSPRVQLSGHDTALGLALQPSGSGSRYATADGSIEWWIKGDSATLTRAGKSTPCGPATDIIF